ncbi:MAG TPA: hypothetical protein DEB39_07180, partial [Planctomycetaceae bacterium]|nr:hypothetical protein [Planctomycetaceae bacterium]
MGRIGDPGPLYAKAVSFPVKSPALCRYFNPKGIDMSTGTKATLYLSVVFAIILSSVVYSSRYYGEKTAKQVLHALESFGNETVTQGRDTVRSALEKSEQYNGAGEKALIAQKESEYRDTAESVAGLFHATLAEELNSASNLAELLAKMRSDFITPPAGASKLYSPIRNGSRHIPKPVGFSAQPPVYSPSSVVSGGQASESSASGNFKGFQYINVSFQTKNRCEPEGGPEATDAITHLQAEACPVLGHGVAAQRETTVDEPESNDVTATIISLETIREAKGTEIFFPEAPVYVPREDMHPEESLSGVVLQEEMELLFRDFEELIHEESLHPAPLRTAEQGLPTPRTVEERPQIPSATAQYSPVTVISPIPSETNETTETTVPETAVPETAVPETTVPETTVPETAVPETAVPETTVPETTVPETTVPETAVPETTVPETTVPETTVPETTVPETAVPETAVPETAVPETTVPETAVPETAVPETTVARDRIEALLKNLFQIQGKAVWTAWEPEAFDDKDIADKDIADRNSEQGRFTLRVAKDRKGTLTATAIRSEFDTKAIRSGQSLSEPRVSQDNVHVVGVSAAIRIQGKNVGVAGYDLPIAALQKSVASVFSRAGGTFVLVSPEGTIVTHPESSKIGKNAVRELKLNMPGDSTKQSAWIDTALGPATRRYVVQTPLKLGSNGFEKPWTVLALFDYEKGIEEITKSFQTIAGSSNRSYNELQGQFTNLEERLKTFDRSAVVAARLPVRLLLFGGIALGIVAAAGFGRHVRANEKESSDRQEQLVNLLREPVMITDESGNLRFLNTAAQGLLKRPSAEALGKPVDAFRQDRIPIRKSEIPGTTGTAGNPIRSTVRTDTRPGSLSFFRIGMEDYEVLCEPLRNSHGKNTGTIEYYRNISKGNELRRVVTSIRHFVTQASDASGEIVGAAETLARGAQQSSYNIEQITEKLARTNELTTTNANNATEANRCTQEAVQAATQGRQRMQSMVASMNLICENADKTKKVIKTIDDIAFQTNLLALNAAVEA